MNPIENYERRAATLWPGWSPATCTRWACARLYADRCRPHFARMLPMYPIKVDNVYQLPIARTRREAGIQ